MKKKIIIVGGVAGGATAAARLRRLDENAELILFERGEYISFANCGLPYYIGGSITNRNRLLLQTAEGMKARFNIDVRTQSEVISISRMSQTVTVKTATGETYEERYDELILSPGAGPIKPPILGLAEAENVFVLRNIPDTDAIKQMIDNVKPKRAVIIGGGFIGIEMAENLAEQGCQVTIVELADQIMAPLDFEMAQIVHQYLADQKIELILQDGIEAFKNNGKTIVLKSGLEITSDITILSIGVRPENELAVASDLKVGSRGGIIVNEFLQTSDPHIWAIGDVIETKDFIQQTPAMIPLASPANRQGRIVADNIYGKNIIYKGALGTAIAKVFDLTIAVTGNNEKTLRRLNVLYQAVHIHPLNHAGYYPGATPISFKMTFNPETGEIYGLQGVGREGVDKRIDVMATAIKGKMTVQQLTDLELAYAPPYSSAKDPINMLGYIASNVCENLTKLVHYHEIDDLIKQGATVIDVRDASERDAGFIQGSIHIPLNDLRQRLTELDKIKPIYVSCQVGLRGYYAARILQQYDFDVYNLSGGYKTYAYANYQMSKLKKVTNENEPTPTSEKMESQPVHTPVAHHKLDVCGLQCPGPIREVYQLMEKINTGEIIEIKVTDPGFLKDIEAWCQKTGNQLIHQSSEKSYDRILVRKGGKPPEQNSHNTKQNATMIVFDQDLDKAIASFIIATGAAAMGKKVTMFFTFWGLNILRKPSGPVPEKTTMEKMFGRMMPRGVNKLPISNMNMGGLGSKMIQHIMQSKNVDNLETLMKNAQDMGVEFIACSMSMDVMGIKREELIDHIEVGGVGAFIGKADDANLNLFI